MYLAVKESVFLGKVEYVMQTSQILELNPLLEPALHSSRGKGGGRVRRAGVEVIHPDLYLRRKKKIQIKLKDRLNRIQLQ